MQAIAGDFTHRNLKSPHHFSGELPASTASEDGQEQAAEPTNGAAALLLDSLIASLGYATAGARILRLPDELPHTLQPIALRTPPYQAWRAWSVDDRTRFVWARICGEVAQKLKRPALLATFYDMDGRQAGSAIWTLQRDGRWRLYDVMEPALPNTRCGEPTIDVDPCPSLRLRRLTPVESIAAP